MTQTVRLALLGALCAAGCSTYNRGAADTEGGAPMPRLDAAIFGPDLPAPSDATGVAIDAPAVAFDAAGFSCATFCQRIANNADCTQAYAGCVGDCAMSLTRDGGAFPEACRGELTTLFTCVSNTSDVRCGPMTFPFPLCLADNGAAHQCIGMH